MAVDVVSVEAQMRHGGALHGTAAAIPGVLAEVAVGWLPSAGHRGG